MTSEQRDEAQRLYWDIAITRKRIETARNERRYNDANDLGRHLEVIEIEARKLLKELPQ